MVTIKHSRREDDLKRPDIGAMIEAEIDPKQRAFLIALDAIYKSIYLAQLDISLLSIKIDQLAVRIK